MRNSVLLALTGKAYMAAEKASVALHTIAVLEVYHVSLLKELLIGEGLTNEV